MGLSAKDASDAFIDIDSDGLTNLEEYNHNLDVSNPDCDGDGLLDGEEVKKYHTDPLNPDSDGDGISDYEEVKSAENMIHPVSDIQKSLVSLLTFLMTIIIPISVLLLTFFTLKKRLKKKDWNWSKFSSKNLRRRFSHEQLTHEQKLAAVNWFKYGALTFGITHLVTFILNLVNLEIVSVFIGMIDIPALATGTLMLAIAMPRSISREGKNAAYCFYTHWVLELISPFIELILLSPLSDDPSLQELKTYSFSLLVVYSIGLASCGLFLYGAIMFTKWFTTIIKSCSILQKRINIISIHAGGVFGAGFSFFTSAGILFVVSLMIGTGNSYTADLLISMLEWSEFAAMIGTLLLLGAFFFQIYAGIYLYYRIDSLINTVGSAKIIDPVIVERYRPDLSENIQRTKYYSNGYQSRYGYSGFISQRNSREECHPVRSHVESPPQSMTSDADNLKERTTERKVIYCNQCGAEYPERTIHKRCLNCNNLLPIVNRMSYVYGENNEEKLNPITGKKIQTVREKPETAALIKSDELDHEVPKEDLGTTKIIPETISCPLCGFKYAANTRIAKCIYCKTKLPKN